MLLYMDGGYRGSETRTSFETSGLTGGESGEVAQQFKDSPVAESMSSEWTDEKHNLYLKSMEASFVNQLYNSTDLLGWRSQQEMSVPKLSGQSKCNTCTPSGQFKVLRLGCWKKINFQRPESQQSSTNESRDLLTSPWIQHFRSAKRPEDVASPALQESAPQSRAIDLNGKKELLCRSATGSKHSHLRNSFSSCHDLVDSKTEMSDQNFVDEDIQGEKGSSSCNSKRMRVPGNDASGSDQVVPYGTPAVAVRVNKECVSAAKYRNCNDGQQ